jgi:hypothetical protein
MSFERDIGRAGMPRALHALQAHNVQGYSTFRYVRDREVRGWFQNYYTLSEKYLLNHSAENTNSRP